MLFSFTYLRFLVTFVATSGGYRELKDISNPTNGIPKNYYVGQTETKEMEFYFDFENPVHCSTNGNCPSGSDTNPLTVEHDITKVNH